MTGFLHGFSQEINHHDVLTHPLSTVFKGAFTGAFYGIGTEVISGFMPEQMRFLIPITALASAIYRISNIDYEKPGQINTESSSSAYVDSDSE